jgi:hypothetical protein
MAFAIFYEPVDLSSLAGSVRAATLPTNLKNLGTKYWNAGLKNWASAPIGQSPAEEPGACSLCRTVVMSGAGVTLAEFRQLLLDVAAFLGTDAARYLIALSADMGGSAGAIEPWP